MAVTRYEKGTVVLNETSVVYFNALSLESRARVLLCRLWMNNDHQVERENDLWLTCSTPSVVFGSRLAPETNKYAAELCLLHCIRFHVPKADRPCESSSDGRKVCIAKRVFSPFRFLSHTRMCTCAGFPVIFQTFTLDYCLIVFLGFVSCIVPFAFVCRASCVRRTISTFRVTSQVFWSVYCCIGHHESVALASASHSIRLFTLRHSYSPGAGPPCRIEPSGCS